MEKKFITKEQKERVSNRLVLNFGVLLAGALVMLYAYNFATSGYSVQVKQVGVILGIISAVLAVAMFVLGLTKLPKMKNYAAIPLGVFLACAVVSYIPLIPAFAKYHYTIEMSIWLVLILMVVYFVVLSIYTAIYTATHPVLVQKKKIQHKKKR